MSQCFLFCVCSCTSLVAAPSGVLGVHRSTLQQTTHNRDPHSPSSHRAYRTFFKKSRTTRVVKTDDGKEKAQQWGGQ